MADAYAGGSLPLTLSLGVRFAAWLRAFVDDVDVTFTVAGDHVQYTPEAYHAADAFFERWWALYCAWQGVLPPRAAEDREVLTKACARRRLDDMYASFDSLRDYLVCLTARQPWDPVPGEPDWVGIACTGGKFNPHSLLTEEMVHFMFMFYEDVTKPAEVRPNRPDWKPARDTRTEVGLRAEAKALRRIARRHAMLLGLVGGPASAGWLLDPVGPTASLERATHHKLRKIVCPVRNKVRVFLLAHLPDLAESEHEAIEAWLQSVFAP